MQQSSARHRDGENETPRGLFMKAMLGYASPIIGSMGDAIQRGDREAAPQNFWEIWNGYTEILACVRALDVSGALLDASVRTSPPINKAEYMRFVFTSHLHELYIMRERMAAYATKMARLYGTSEKVVLDLPGWVKEHLEGVSAIRSRHVHAMRFDTEELHMLSSYEMIATSEYTESRAVRLSAKAARDQSLRKLRRLWRVIIESNKSVVDDLLDRYFDTLARVMLKDGVLIPPGAKAATKSGAAKRRPAP